MVALFQWYQWEGFALVTTIRRFPPLTKADPSLLSFEFEVYKKNLNF
jgi:hypothetical protein